MIGAARRRAGAAVSWLLVLTAALVGAAVPAGAAEPAGAAGSARSGGSPLADAVVRTGPSGTAVVSEGPLTAAQFASYSPDPAATTDLFGRLTTAGTVRTYQRVWADPQFDVAVTDLVAEFSTSAEAAAYQKGQDDALTTAAAVTTAPVAGVPGAQRDTFPITSPVAGTEQVVVLADRDAVATVTFTVAATATGPQTTGATATDVDAFAGRQHRRLVTVLATPAADPAGSPAAAVVAGWVLLAVAATLVVVLAVVLVRRRRVNP
ncbi:MAG TPA: hypothetical protein VGG23_11015 [Acidimicrobiales bacterium]